MHAGAGGVRVLVSGHRSRIFRQQSRMSQAGLLIGNYHEWMVSMNTRLATGPVDKLTYGSRRSRHQLIWSGRGIYVQICRDLCTKVSTSLSTSV